MKREIIWKFLILLLAITLASLNQFHVLTQLFTQPANTVFTGIAHYYADYFLYVSHITQGADGKLLTDQLFTNEPMGATWIYWFNTVIGRIGSMSGLSPFASYNIALFVLIIVLILLWFYVAKRIVRSNTIAFYITLIIGTASNFISLKELITNGALVQLGGFWFSPTPAFNRLGGVPHQVFQTILFLLLLIFYVNLIEKPTKKPLRFIPLGLLALLATTANPIQMLLFVLGAASFTILSIVKEKRIRLAVLTPFVIIALLSLPAAILTNKAFEIPVFAIAKTWENAQIVSISFITFVQAVGPVLFLAAIGIVFVKNHITPVFSLLGLYGLLSFLFFFSPLPKLFGTTNVRYLHPAPYGILGILAGIAIFHLSRIIPKKIPRISSGMITVFFISIYLACTIPSIIAQIRSRVDPKENSILVSGLNHVPQTIVDTLMVLKKQPITTRPVVITDISLPYDVLVPAFTGKVSFTGHPIHTLYPAVKDLARKDLFEGRIQEEKAKTFFSDHRIGYILASPKSTDLIRILPGVHELSRNETTVLFSVL